MKSTAPTAVAGSRSRSWVGHVLAVSANRRVPPTPADPRRRAACLIPPRAWQRYRWCRIAGPRLYSWAWFRLLAEGDADTGTIIC